jgi:hypothetical protein
MPPCPPLEKGGECGAAFHGFRVSQRDVRYCLEKFLRAATDARDCLHAKTRRREA